MQESRFGTPTLPDYYEADEQCCFKAGQAWAKTSPRKLPRIATVQCKGYERQVPIVGSSHEFAKAFVRGWRVQKLEAQLPQE